MRRVDGNKNVGMLVVTESGSDVQSARKYRDFFSLFYPPGNEIRRIFSPQNASQPIPLTRSLVPPILDCRFRPRWPQPAISRPLGFLKEERWGGPNKTSRASRLGEGMRLERNMSDGVLELGTLPSPFSTASPTKSMGAESPTVNEGDVFTDQVFLRPPIPMVVHASKVFDHFSCNLRRLLTHGMVARRHGFDSRCWLRMHSRIGRSVETPGHCRKAANCL